MSVADHADGVSLLARACYEYLSEIEQCRSICEQYEATAAIHDTGAELQVYRMFKRDEVTARQIRHAADDLASWKEAPSWKCNGKSWMKMERDILGRMAKHSKLHPIVTKGIEWEGRPILIHAYKFEPDPVMKVELVLPYHETPFEELPLQVIASALRCHEHIIPRYIATALPPHERHEAKLLTIQEYLSHSMPKELYASQCFPASITPVLTRGVLPRQ